MFRVQILAFFIVLFLSIHLIAQDEDINLPDNSKPDFKEGFYFSIDMVLKNDPISPSWIESENAPVLKNIRATLAIWRTSDTG